MYLVKCSNPSALCAAAVLAVASVGAQAASISYKVDSGASPDATNWSKTLNLGKFDSSLGTLNSIVFTLEGQVSWKSAQWARKPPMSF
jgi:hypothetical protein